MKVVTYIVIVLMTCLAGCTRQQADTPQETQTAQHTLITSKNLDAIAGTQWILEEMIFDGSAYPLSARKPFIKIAFNGKVNGIASLNTYFGSVQIDDKGAVTWPMPFGSTKMAGPEILMQQEDAFLEALTKISSFSVEGFRLTAQSADGQTKLIFHAPVE